MLSAPAICQRRGQVLLGRPICQQGFRKLLSLGSNRYTRLKQAASQGELAPVDGRSAPRRHSFVGKQGVEALRKRSLIAEYLQELYDTISEPMPDANQSIKRKAAVQTEAGDLVTQGKSPMAQWCNPN